MSQARATARSPTRRENGQQGESSLGSSVKGVLQAISIFYLGQFAINKFTGGGAQKPTPAAKSRIPSFDDGAVAPKDLVNEFNPVPQNIAPLWEPNSAVDVSIYLSSSLALPTFSQIPEQYRVLEETNFVIGDWQDKRTVDTTFTVPVECQYDAMLWAHMFVALHGHQLDPKEPDYDVKKAYHFSRPMNQVLPKKKVAKTKKLLGGSGSESEEESEPKEEQPKGATFASYYHPNFTVSFIPDSGIVSYPHLHPAPRSNIVLETTGARDASGQNGWYYPVLFMNTFWQLRDHMTELNSSVTEVPLHIDLDNMSNWKFSMYSSIDENVKANQRAIAEGKPAPGGGDGSEFEEFKRILIDTNIYLLSTTAVVTVLHMVFEMLAFKNDVSHWRSKKDNVGVSFRTILANVVMQGIIFLYLLDNSEGTSWMILFGQGMGIAIEAWKITKTVDVRVRPSPPGSIIPYQVTFEDKHVLSETEKKTQEYDQIAFRYLYIVAVPLLLAYAAYSVMYEEHKGWYSFVITTLVGSVYAYGFLMMVPSLYINYRLKSVAHMPAKAMTYKFLNTFIDDLFAFTIKMPTLHRLATLRDDVIFFVYIYQSYKYKVDYTRINEFGQGGDDEEVTAIEEKKEEENKTLEITEITEETEEVVKASGTEPEGKKAKKRK